MFDNEFHFTLFCSTCISKSNVTLIYIYLHSRVHDIYENRVLHVLDSMNNITLHVLPDDCPWTVEHFIEKAEEKSNQAALVSIFK